MSQVSGFLLLFNIPSNNFAVKSEQSHHFPGNYQHYAVLTQDLSILSLTLYHHIPLSVWYL